MGVDSKDVPRQMWQLVWKGQLRLARKEDFWKGLRGDPIQYATPPVPEPEEPLPPFL